MRDDIKGDGRDPFDIEGVDFRTCTTTREMEREAADALTSWAACQDGPAIAFAVAPVSSAKRQMELSLCELAGPIARACDMDGLARGLCDVLGLDCELASRMQIRACAREALRRAMGRRPSAAAVDVAVEMLGRSVAVDDGRLQECLGAARDAVRLPAECVREFEELLGGLGATFPNRALDAALCELEARHIPSRLLFMMEDPSRNDEMAKMVCRRASALEHCDVVVLRKDAGALPLADAARRLDCRFAVAHGAHAYDGLVADVVEGLMAEGADPSDIAVIVPGLQGECGIMGELARRGIGFEASVADPLGSTALGRFLLDAVEWGALRRRGAAPGASAREAREERRAAEREEALAGELAASRFATGPDMAPLLSDGPGIPATPLSRAIAGGGLDAVLDAVECRLSGEIDVAAWKAAREFSEEAADGFDAEDLAGTPVRLRRESGEPGERIEIGLRSNIQRIGAAHVVMSDMDASSCAGYSGDTPFSPFLEAMGVETDHWERRRLLRAQVADAMDAARSGSITFARCANSTRGDALPAAAVLSEVAGGFGGIGDDGAPPDAPCAIRSESDGIAVMAGEARGMPTDVREPGLGVSAATASRLLSIRKRAILSPTEVKTFWDCPRKWLLSEKFAGYGEADERTGWDSPAKRGEFAHLVLQNYYEGCGARDWRAGLSEPANASAFEAAFAGSLDEIGGERGDGAWMRSEAMWKARLSEMLEADRDVLPGFEPAFLEEWFELDVAGARLCGRIDRADVSEDGKRAVIVDYKGGLSQYDFSAQNIDERMDRAVQPLIYALAFEAAHPGCEVVGIALRSYAKPGADGVKKAMEVPWRDGDRSRKLPPGGFRELLGAFEARLAEKIADMTAGRCPASPASGHACRYCPMEGSCPANPRR